MAGFCVILSGRLPGDKDDAAVWAPLKAAFKLDDASFAQRVLVAVPLIVRQNIDEPTATSLVAKMVASGIDARAAQEDSQLVYFERGGTRRGPVPRASLAEFILPGERYRLRGEQEWISWADTAPTIEAPAAPISAHAPVTTLEEEISSSAPHVDDSFSPPFLTGALDSVPGAESSTTQATSRHSETPPPLPPPTSALPESYEHSDPESAAVFADDSVEDFEAPAPPSGDPMLAADLEDEPAPSRSRAGLWVAGVAVVAIAAGVFAWSSLNHESASPATVALPNHAPQASVPVAPVVSPAHASTAQSSAALSISPAPAASASADPAKAGSSSPASTATSAVVTALASPSPAPHSNLPRHCEAGATNPQTPEEITLLGNGQNHLTGRNVRAGPGGEIFIVEAALGYDAQCRPSPYQVYVFSHGKLAGTLSPQPMQVHSDGAIADFKLIDPEHLQIDIEHYKPGDTTGNASSHDQVVVDLHQFIESQKTATPSAATSSAAAPVTRATTDVTAKAPGHPSFD